MFGPGVSLGAGVQVLPEPPTYLWAWGKNYAGQLGLGDVVDRSSPVQVGALGTWAQIGAVQGSRGFTHAVKKDGTLWSWGANNSGMLGLGDKVYRSSPVQVGALTNWTNSLMPSHYPNGACHVKSDGTAWFFGRISNMLNNGVGVVVTSPSQVASDKTWAVTVTGTNTSWFGITTGGALWSSCYSNTVGMSGQNNTTSTSSPAQVGTLTNWAGVYPGDNGVIARKTDGTLWSWGSAATANSKAFLGQNDAVSRSSPTQIGALTTWARISVVKYSCLAVKTDGTLWTWGDNTTYGQLGLGDTVPRSSPTQVGALTNWLTTANTNAMVYSASAIAVKGDGTLWTWGRDYWGALGNNTGRTTRVNKSSPTQVGSLTTWTKVGANYNAAFAISSQAT